MGSPLSKNRELSKGCVRAKTRNGSDTTSNRINNDEEYSINLVTNHGTTYDNVHGAVASHYNNISNPDMENKTPGVVGLKNLGNTCFMNSSLQCLSNTIPLTDYFLGFDYKSELNVDNVLGTGGHLATSYAKLMNHMWQPSSLSSSRDVVRPDWFRKDLSKFCPHLFSSNPNQQPQEDAHEFLAYFLDGIHEDLNRVPSNNKPYIDGLNLKEDTTDEEHAVIAWESYLKRNKSIVVDLFQGQLRNTLTCLTCHKKQVQFDPFMYLSLPIPKDKSGRASHSVTSLDDCLDLFLSQERLEGDNEWYCPACKKRVEATKKFDIWIMPPILIIHLKRFEYTSYRKIKIDKIIDYPLTQWKFPLQAGSSDASLRKNRQQNCDNYELYAISHHRGSGLGSGHYTAHCKNRFDDEWYDFNDSRCELVNSLDSLRCLPSAYCLFYNRVKAEQVPKSKRDIKILRQTITRPDLWPHAQVSNNDRDRTNRFRSFSRESTVLTATNFFPYRFSLK